MMGDVAKQFPNLWKSRAADGGTPQPLNSPAAIDVPPAQGVPILRQEDLRLPTPEVMWPGLVPGPNGIVPGRSDIQSPLQSPNPVLAIQKKEPQLEDRLTGGQLHVPGMTEQQQQQQIENHLVLRRLLVAQMLQQTGILTGWQENLSYTERSNQVWNL